MKFIRNWLRKFIFECIREEREQREEDQFIRDVLNNSCVPIMSKEENCTTGAINLGNGDPNPHVSMSIMQNGQVTKIAQLGSREY